MSLDIYERDITKEYNMYVGGSVFNISDLTLYGALRVYHTPNGSVVSRRLFIHNSDLSKYYRNVIISIAGNTDTIVGEDPYYQYSDSPLLVKLHKGWLQPDTITWLKKDSFNSIMWDNIGYKNSPDIQYLPFWVAVEFVGTATQQIINELTNSSLSLHIDYEEYDHGRTKYKRYFK